jgi:hypothetical protein
MVNSRKIGSVVGFGAAAMIAVALSAPAPVEAAGFVGISFGVPFGFPFYYPPYPPPYYYPPPPPPAAYYPPPGAQPSGGYPPAASRAPAITYTPRRAWTDAAGRQCREYRTTRQTDGRATQVYGTACRDPDGQWRIVN